MKTIKSVKLDVVGMACASCAQSVQRTLKSQSGVLNAEVNIASNIAQIEFDAEITDLKKLKVAVKEIGFELLTEKYEIDAKNEIIERERKILKNKLIVSLVFAIPLAILSMAFHSHTFISAFILFLLSLPVVFYGGSHFFTRAFKQVKKGIFTMDALIALGAGSAFLFSCYNLFFKSLAQSHVHSYEVYFESAAIIIALVLLGKNLEERTRRKASDSVKSLLNLQAKKAILLDGDKEIEVEPEKLKKGDIAIVKSGEKIPSDGVIIAGSAALDESMINGESTPSDKSIGDSVVGGSVNLNGYLKIEVAKACSESLLANIIKIVENAQNSKPEIQKLADKISSIFVPTIIIIAVIVFAYWGIIEGNIEQAIISMATTLVVACPCALGLATPTAIIAGIGRASEIGVLIKDANAQEALSEIDAVIFDKTGSLTIGKPEIAQVMWFDSQNGRFKSIIYSLESLSSHPLAKPIVAYFNKVGANKIDAISFESFSGFGIKGEFPLDSAQNNSETYYLGSEKYIRDSGIDFALDNNFKESSNAIALFADSKHLICAIALNDTIKESAISAIKYLQKNNITAILSSGDSENAVKKTAQELGINKYYFRQSPIDKSETIKELQKAGKKVAMLGDGINDAPALALADVGVAMANGSDLAIESAQIALIGGDLHKFIDAHKLSKKMRTIIRENLFWAFFYNVIMIPIAAGLFIHYGLTLSPMLAAGAMALSSVSVVSNSLRLKYFKI